MGLGEVRGSGRGHSPTSGLETYSGQENPGNRAIRPYPGGEIIPGVSEEPVEAVVYAYR